MSENFKQKKQETTEELAANISKYSHIIENINGALYMTNENGFVNFISKSVQDVFGYRKDEVLGKNFLKFVSEEDLQVAKTSFARLSAEKNSLSEFRFKSKEGKLKPVICISKTVFNKSEFAGVMGILIEVSEIKNAKEKFNSKSNLLKNVGEGAIAINLITERRDIDLSNDDSTENASSEIKLKLSELLENSKILFYTHTPDHTINFASPYSKRLLGIDPDEDIIRWTELLTENPVNQKGIELTEIAIETGIPPKPFEIEMRNDKKEILWFVVQELPIVKDGKTVLMIGSLIDITKQKKEFAEAENRLHETEERYRILAESEEDMVFEVNPSYIVQYANSYAINFLEKKPQDIRGKSLLDLLPTNTAEKLIRSINKIFEKKLPVNYVDNLYISNKSLYWEIRLVPNLDTIGNIKSILGIVRNITNKKTAENTLKESEERFRNLTDSLPQTIFEINKELRITYANKTAYNMFLYSHEDINNGLTMDRIVYPKDMINVIDRFQRVLAGDKFEFSGMEITAVRKDGSYFPCLVYASPIIKEGQAIGIRGILVDNTERNKLVEEIVQAKEKAEESNRLKSYFLANMSHELRTPMAGILGLSEILIDELTEPSHIEIASNILKSGKRLIYTLNSILDTSRIEANKQVIKTSLVNINEVIKEVIELYNPHIDNKKIYIKYFLPEKNLYINSDNDLLHKIFTNLIDNAVKYTNEGGIVVKLIERDEELIKKILIEITDTGIGIPKEYHNIIFEPFRQVSEGFSRKFDGTGLGLSITKKFVELLNGSITLKSNPGEGSTFTIIFPCSNKVEEITPHSINTLTKKVINDNLLNNISVLLVEDDKSNALVVAAYLEGYMSVDIVSNGNAAIKVCKTFKYDAILMDINLKGIDGVETFKQIRKIDNHYANIPVIAITAYAMLGDREKFLSLGFTHYISKPFDRIQLLLLLKTIFKND